MKPETQEHENLTVGDIEAARTKIQEESVELEEVENRKEEPDDPYLVTWKGENDPENPLNFPKRRKVLAMAMIGALAFLTYSSLYPTYQDINTRRPTASAMISPAIPIVMAKFHVSSAVLGSFSVSMFVLGYAIGPL